MVHRNLILNGNFVNRSVFFVIMSDSLCHVKNSSYLCIVNLEVTCAVLTLPSVSAKWPMASLRAGGRELALALFV